MLRHIVRFTLAAAIVIAAGTLSPPLAQQPSVTVFAAASMKNALDDINAAFTKATGIKVVTSYAASSALMRQIEQGAPADVFVSADLEWMDYGAQNKLIKHDTRVNLLGNRLVLIAPKDSKIGSRDASRRASISRSSPATAASSPATCGGAGRPLRQGGAGEARRLGRGREARSPWSRTCARRSRWSRAARPRSASSTRPTPRSSPSVKIVGRFPPNSHPPIVYPVGADRQRQAGGRALPRLPALGHGEVGLRSVRLHLPDQADVVRRHAARPADA